MPELSKPCPNCSGILKYKYAQYVDYLICDTCKQKFTESTFRIGERSFDETQLFHLAYYSQKEPVQKTIMYFAGANRKLTNQAKKGLNQSRVYKFADAHHFNVICVGTKQPFFDDGKDYRPLIKYLFEKNNLKEEQVILVGFSNGGIPTTLCGSFFNFYKVCFISPVLSEYVYEFCKHVQTEVLIIKNIKDEWFQRENFLLEQALSQQQKKYKSIEVDTGHYSHKSFEKLIDYIFGKVN